MGANDYLIKRQWFILGELSKGFLEEVTPDLGCEGWVCWLRPYASKLANVALPPVAHIQPS